MVWVNKVAWVENWCGFKYSTIWSYSVQKHSNDLIVPANFDKVYSFYSLCLIYFVSLFCKRNSPIHDRFLVYLSACLSVCPSVTKFSKDWIITFFYILHGPWHLVTGGAKFLGKKTLQSKFGPNRQKSDPKLVFFLPFSQVWSLSFSWSCIQW